MQHNRVNMFQDSKASKRFYDISEQLSGEQKKKFSVEVRNLFDRKTTSYDGEYSTFKITTDDLRDILLENKFIKK